MKWKKTYFQRHIIPTYHEERLIEPNIKQWKAENSYTHIQRLALINKRQPIKNRINIYAHAQRLVVPTDSQYKAEKLWTHVQRHIVPADSQSKKKIMYTCTKTCSTNDTQSKA